MKLTKNAEVRAEEGALVIRLPLPVVCETLRWLVYSGDVSGELRTAFLELLLHMLLNA